MESHLKQVVQMSSAFRSYIKAAHMDMDHSTMAYRQGNRADGVPSTPSKGGTAY